MNFWQNLMLVRRMLSKRPKHQGQAPDPGGRCDCVRITAAEPVACQIDGDFVGLRAEMTFRAVPEALGVVAPPAKIALTSDNDCALTELERKSD